MHLLMNEDGRKNLRLYMGPVQGQYRVAVRPFVPGQLENSGVQVTFDVKLTQTVGEESRTFKEIVGSMNDD